jgi:type I restriction enzyme M protein
MRSQLIQRENAVANTVEEQNSSKEVERAELHKTIWRIANDLRGSIDGWDFKSYVLGMLFYRFISENLTYYINELERKAGSDEFDYAQLSDEDAEYGRSETVKEKGFYILPSELFVSLRTRARSDTNLNETLSRIFANIEGSAVGSDSEYDFKGLFEDLDVNSNKLGPTVPKRNEKLVKLLDAIGDLPLATSSNGFSGNTIDLFGDAYEYLMQMYASTAGKSGGEFYTPQEVSELLARITVVGKSEVNKVYDPACGSGSLLLNFAKVLGHDNVRQGFYGQEINLTTYNLCRINMFLHDVNYEKFNIAHGDTLTDPAHWDDEPFEAIVSNPPYSIRWDGDANPLLINDPRFAPAGVLAPKSKADLAFTMHILSWLAVNGTAAIVEFPGVLYRGGAEQKIRQYLIDNNYVDAVIQLPPDLFFGTPIATCIIVLKKSKRDNATLFIDASAEFVRVGNKNKLLEEHRQKIIKAFTARGNEEHFAQLVDNEKIVANDYNISVSSYVEKEDTRQATDIKRLNTDIANMVVRQSELRANIDTIVSDVEVDDTGIASSFHVMEKLLNGVDVEWKVLGEIISPQRGRRLVKSQLKETGSYPVYQNSMTPLGYFHESNASAGTSFVIVAGAAGQIGYSTVDYWAADDIYVFPKSTAISGKYIYHFLLTQMHEISSKVRRASIPRLPISAIERLKIPVPYPEDPEKSLDVQADIVRILDAFTELSAQLSVELTAELEARRQQYAYYRDRLLSFSFKEVV